MGSEIQPVPLLQHPPLVAVVKPSLIPFVMLIAQPAYPASPLCPSATWHTVIFPESKSGTVLSYLKKTERKKQALVITSH
jgi:hypothetical protein